MTDEYVAEANDDSSLPLHELMSQVLAPDRSRLQRASGLVPALGTMQRLNQRLARQPIADFVNAILRGIGQVVFVNNPLSGLLILLALAIQSPWIAVMSLLGLLASTLTAIWLQLDRTAIRNGIFGYNGILVGAALAIFGLSGNGSWHAGWAIAVIVFAAHTTVLMKTMGMWLVTRFKVPPLTLPFNLVTLFFLSAVLFLPQSFFDLGPPALPAVPLSSINWLNLVRSLPIGFGQIFLVDRLLPGCLIFLAVAICTPLGALVGLLGCCLGVAIGLVVGVAPGTLYAGLWGYNAILTALAIGGVFYAPTLFGILLGCGCAIATTLFGGALSLLLSFLGLPVLSVPFCMATMSCVALMRKFLPSLVPVALHAVTSPEEHRQRYLVAREVISNFRRQLKAAIAGQRHHFLFDRSSVALRGDLRYIFDAIDTDRSGTLSTQELATHLRQAGQVPSETELAYLFDRMDADGNGEIDFAEFGELMLRHQRLMARYDEFRTYFVPIDANGDDCISLDEMNVAFSSVNQPLLSAAEAAFLHKQANGKPLTWNRFIEMLLVT